jgi:mannosyltransferase OCH1-like enzyme
MWFGFFVLLNLLLLCTGIGFFLYFTWCCNCVFHETYMYETLPRNLAPSNSTLSSSSSSSSSSSEARGVPKLFHQTWKTEDLLPRHERCRQTWLPFLQKHGWTSRFWTDALLELFVETNFAWYLPVWHQLRPFIKKVDVFRYLLLWHQGGLYVDMDMEALEADRLFQVLEQGSAQRPMVCFVPVQHTPPSWPLDTDAASPALLASTAGHPFWLHLLRYIALNHHKKHVIEATGPIAVSNALLTWPRTADIMLLSEATLGLGFWPFLKKHKWCYHHNTTTWGGGKGELEADDEVVPEDVTSVLEHIEGLLSRA